MASLPESPGLENQDRLILTLWNAAGKTMQHGMSCRCCGGGMFSMSPKVLEADMLDYLADKYQGEGVSALHDAVSRRIADPGDEGLIAWLRALGASDALPAPLLDRLKADIIDLLQNMQAAPGF